MNRQFNKIIFLLVSSLLCLFLIVKGQTPTNGKVDSLVKSFLIQNKILTDPVRDIIYKKGEIISENSNYYIKQKDIKISDTSTINLIVFGANKSHPQDYLIINYKGSSDNYIFLGKNLFEDDLLILVSFFEKRRQELPLVVRRKILLAFCELR